MKREHTAGSLLIFMVWNDCPDKVDTSLSPPRSIEGTLWMGMMDFLRIRSLKIYHGIGLYVNAKSTTSSGVFSS